MSKIVIFGNSGSGKSTLAQRYVSHLGFSHLDLDTIAWEAGGDRKKLAASLVDLRAFMDAHAVWVIEGCYGSLIEAVSREATELLFLNPGTNECLENCRSRPWEPHKYASMVEQEKNLEMLLRWVSAYQDRADDCSLRAHRALFEQFSGPKQELRSREAIRNLRIVPIK